MRKKKGLLEKDIEQKFLRLVKKEFPHLRVPKLGMLSQRSWPDRMIPLPKGRTLFIEFKRPGEKATELQLDCHEFLRNMGHYVQVFDDAEEAFNFLSRML